jgi:two-component system cell cycle response regulator DivK
LLHPNSEITVLVVEDNPVNLELFLDILSETDYQCLSATDGPSAIAIAREARPDVVLLDIQLPGMDGMEVLASLKSMKETQGAKIIALTAYAMKGDRENFLAKGFDDYVSKPIKMKELLASIKRQLASQR